MGKLLALVIGYALSSFVAKIFTALGISLLTYSGLQALVNEFLNLIEPIANGLPLYVLNILAIAGVPEAFSVIASALLTRAALQSARVWLGVLT